MKKTFNYANGSAGVSFWLALDPVACPRPRIRVVYLPGGKKMGMAYYTGKYKVFTAEAPSKIPSSEYFYEKGVPVTVNIRFFMQRPASPANSYPVGDIDNYCKSILDAITKNGTYWHDDSQVVSLKATKQYGTLDYEAPGTQVIIKAAQL